MKTGGHHDKPNPPNESQVTATTMQTACTKTRYAKASFEKASAKKLPLNSGGNTGSASLEACVPNAPSCCTPVGSPDAPHRRDNLCLRDTDTAAANVAAGARQ